MADREPAGDGMSAVTDTGRIAQMLLLPHQEREVNFLRTHPRALLLSEMGTGKTITLLTRAGEVLAAGGKVLYVTTKTVEEQVHQESARWLPEDQQPVMLASGPDEARFITCTHNLAHRRLSHLTDSGPFDLVIVDEAKAVGGGGTNPQHKTYTALREISHAAGSAVLATAEPLGSVHALDLWAIADVAGVPDLPSRYEMNGYVHWQEFQQGRYTKKVPVSVSEDGFLLLLNILKPNQIRTTMENVADLPDVTVEHHPVALTEDASRLYVAASNLNGLNGHQARQAASRDAMALVPEVLLLLANDYAHHKSVIVFSDMFDLIDPLAAAMEHAGVSFVQIDGSTSTTERGRLLEQHRKGEARVLLMTSAGEAGFNGQHASLLISAVQSYSPARESQRVGRIRRIGTRHSELVHAIVRPEVGHEVRREQILAGKEHRVAQMWQVLS
jgi:superfamily II DNA or RNA helicase